MASIKRTTLYGKKQIDGNYLLSPQEVKALNDMFMTLWLKIFGNIDIADLSDDVGKKLDITENKDIIQLYADTVDIQGNIVTISGNIISLTSRIEGAEASLTIQADEIATKVSQTSFNELTNRVSTAETSITQNAQAIALKASATDVETLDGRMDSAESTITIQAGQISSKVSQEDYTGNTIASLINQTATTIQIAASKINLNGYVTITGLNTLGSADRNAIVTIADGVVSASEIKCDQISSYNADPIIKLFGSDSTVSLDATANNETGGQGSAIRLKWDRQNYVAVYDGHTDIYVDNTVWRFNSDGTINLNGNPWKPKAVFG
jgi:hypothetical protein